MSTTVIKKISYFTALVIMTGGTIGAGIFYKSKSILTNSHNDFVLAIISWLVAAFGIICIGLALVEISSIGKRDLGIISWIKTFTTKKIGKFCSLYMLLIYYPVSIITLAIYGVNAIEDAYTIGTGYPLFSNGYIPAAIALVICLWLFIISWLSFKITESLQWIFTIIKFVPIIILPIFAYIFAASKEPALEEISNPTLEKDGFLALSKGWGIIASIPAILFTFDGFFTVASIKSNLKNKKHLPSIILLGLIVITSFYLYISIAFSIPNNNGTATGIGKIPKKLQIIMLSFISVSVIGVVNGYTIATNRVYIIATNERDFYFLAYLYKKFKNLTKRDVSYLFLTTLTILLFTIFTPFTIEIWKLNTQEYNHSLYSMADILTNYTSLFVFIIIGFTFIGGLRNRKTNKINVEKCKLFIPSAIISILFLSVGTFYFFLSPLLNLIFLKSFEDKMRNIVTFLVMIATIILTWLNMYIEIYFDRKQGKFYFPPGYVSIDVLIDNENATKEQINVAYSEFDKEGWIRIKEYLNKKKINEL